MVVDVNVEWHLHVVQGVLAHVLGDSDGLELSVHVLYLIAQHLAPLLDLVEAIGESHVVVVRVPPGLIARLVGDEAALLSHLERDDARLLGVARYGVLVGEPIGRIEAHQRLLVDASRHGVANSRAGHCCSLLAVLLSFFLLSFNQQQQIS